MNEEQQMIIDTTRRILTDLCGKDTVDAAENGEFPSELWQVLEDTGLTLAGISESCGGSGGVAGDSLRVIREAAGFAAPIPLSETYIAAALLAKVGAKCPAGPVTVVSGDFTFARNEQTIQIAGAAINVNFAKNSQAILLVADAEICLVSTANLDFGEGKNLAGEWRGQFDFGADFTDAQLFALPSAANDLLHLGAITRVNMMAGAMSAILTMSVAYSLERQQFGRPIAQFQAVQQQLAVLAGEVAACQRAADSVLESPDAFDIAVAKARVGEAVTAVADISHQVHGAMGYTLEHGLNLLTRRLWDWRDEYGNETYWQVQIGESIVKSGADALWDRITQAA